jgi:hypothetical protein
MMNSELKIDTQATHVFDVGESSHTGRGCYLRDATDNSEPKPYPDYRPVVTEICKAGTVSVLFTKVSGIGRDTVWMNGKGEILDWSEEPQLFTIESFHRMFGGSEFCTIL